MILFMLLFTSLLHATAPHADLQLLNQDQNHYQWRITLPLDKGDIFYADYFDLTVDNPSIVIDSWKIDQATHEAYDATFKQNKKIIEKPIHIAVATTIQEMPSHANFHLTYYRRSHKTISHEMLPIPYTPPLPAEQPILEEEEKHYSLLKKRDIFYTPQPIPIAIIILVMLIIAYQDLKRRSNMRGIILIALAVFLIFQLMKSLIINWAKPYQGGYTALSDRKPKPFGKSTFKSV